jgi:hypothetical protein
MTLEAPLNHSLLCEVIFANDEAFAEIDVEKAKMMLCVCKNAKNNRNIKASIDNAKARDYCKQIINLSIRKTNNEFYNRLLSEFDGESDLNIDSIHKEQVNRIIASVSNESQSVIEGIKHWISIEQIRNIDIYYTQLQRAIGVINRLGIDINNISEEDMDLCDEDDEYYSIKYNRIEIATIYKYNSYVLNMLVNKNKEDEIIKYISTEEYDNSWWNSKTPIIHPI